MPNIFDSEFEREVDQGPFSVKGVSVGRQAGSKEIGATVYELAPGKRNFPYHAHHGFEEMIVVLEGSPTIRTPEGERELRRGDVHCFGKGSQSAHQVINNTGAAVRFLMLSSISDADFAEYPDGGKLAVFSGEWGTPDSFRKLVAAEPEVGYFEGETG